MEQKQTIVEVKPYEEIIEELQKESLVFAAYYNDEGKVLIAKGPYFKRFSLPAVRVTQPDATYSYLNPILRKEFGINTYIKDYIELVRGFYKAEDGQYKLGNFICFFANEYHDYPGKPELTPEPEIFSEAKYVTHEELIQMYENDEVTEYTMYYVGRVQEKVMAK